MNHAEVLRRLYETLVENEFHEIDVRFPDFSCRLLIEPGAGEVAGPDGEVAAGPEDGLMQDPTDPEAAEVVRITAERVGVFRGGKEQVVVGQKVPAGRVLGIIKGISVQDQVVAPREGKILEVGIKDGEIVEFGRILFTLGPVGHDGK